MSGDEDILAIVDASDLHFVAGYSIGRATVTGLQHEDASEYVAFTIKRYRALGSEEVEEFDLLLAPNQAAMIGRLLTQAGMEVSVGGN